MLKQEGYDLMGAAFEVYNELGYGMAEEIYQQSLEIEQWNNRTRPAQHPVPQQGRRRCRLQRSYSNHQVPTGLVSFW